ncbi:MAG: ectonucleotide pyrophosphatase/phosphodiesterase [Thermoflexales bacterium]|nr:ectonucleotide pyrophosphatase/phosphodiesterase [Thermoflexales bacterium]
MVVLVSIDGLRPDAIDAADCPRLRALRARSAHTARARTVMPSITLPCHTSLFHGVPPERHGITTNTFTPMARPVQGLIDLAHSYGRRCAMFYNWEALRDVARPEKLALSLFKYHGHEAGSDQVIADWTATWLNREAFDFAFVYFGMTDEMGHRYGWMSEGYLEQVAVTDRALGTLLDALPAEAHVLVQSDHGGHDRTHGTEMDEDMQIPWMLSGPGVRAGHTLSGPVSILDSAPTLAHLLELRAPKEWEGRVVAEAFAS